MHRFIPVLLFASCASPQAGDPQAPLESAQAAAAQEVAEVVAEPAPVFVHRSREFAAANQSDTWVRGIYRQADVRKRQSGEPVYRGHVTVELADGFRVFIEPTWSDAAIRPQAEISKFEGQVVEVRGTLWERCPTPPETVAAIISPCLKDVVEVRPHAAQYTRVGHQMLPVCDQFSPDARACIDQGMTWGRYASPYCGGARPNPGEQQARVDEEMTECRCYSPEALEMQARDCSRRP